MNKRFDILDRKNDILQWIAEELPKCEICKRLSCKHTTLESYLKEMNIDYKGQQAKKGQYKGRNAYTSIDEYLAKSRYIKSDDFKKKLIKFGIKEAKCECCQNTMWNGQPIPLELHHIDGNHYNNSLDNVQILCPNCHAMCDNNAGRNTKAFKANLSVPATQRPCRLREKAYTPEQSAQLIANGKVDAFGRPNDRILTEAEWDSRKQLILNANVDFTKYGWKTKLEQATGLSRRQVCNTIEHYPNIFNNIIYIRGK